MVQDFGFRVVGLGIHGWRCFLQTELLGGVL